MYRYLLSVVCSRADSLRLLKNFKLRQNVKSDHQGFYKIQSCKSLLMVHTLVGVNEQLVNAWFQA